MTLNKITQVVYALIGILYVLVGMGSMLLPTGWLPQSVGDNILAGEVPSPFFGHLLQEFGTVVLALGFVFLWYARRKEQSRGFHWTMTFYFSLDALIHWVGPEGLIGSWSRGIVNSVPFAVMLVLGLLQLRASESVRLRGAA